MATVECDSSYAYVASDGLPTHTMMDGITASNLQVPIAQKFVGANAWKIPLQPAIAASTTTANDGPIGVAINGVPIFNPCKQGGCQNGDTKALGELDVCNGHAGRADDYHYHAAPTCLMAGKPAGYWDTHPLGWALDGFAIFGFNDADGRVASRDDVCGGNTSAVANAPSGYSYHVTDTSPYVLSCFRGTPSPDLAGQGAKFSPLRPPPVRPFAVSAMTLSTDAADGYQVLQFQSDRPFTSTETGSDSYANTAGTYRIRYQAVTGSALATLLAQSAERRQVPVLELPVHDRRRAHHPARRLLLPLTMAPSKSIAAGLLCVLLAMGGVGSADAHGLAENRATFVLRDQNHVSMTLFITFSEALHRALAPQRSFQEFVLAYAAMPPDDFKATLLKAENQFQTETQAETPDGHRTLVRTLDLARPCHRATGTARTRHAGACGAK